MPFVFNNQVFLDTGPLVWALKPQGKKSDLIILLLVKNKYSDFRFGCLWMHEKYFRTCKRSNFLLAAAAIVISVCRRSWARVFFLVHFLRSFLFGEANLTDWNRLSSEQTRKATAITAKSCSVLYLTVWVKTDGGGMSGGSCEVEGGWGGREDFKAGFQKKDFKLTST